MKREYEKDQLVIEHIGFGEQATEYTVRIAVVSDTEVMTETGHTYCPLTGMRTNKAETYRSIRHPRRKEPTP